MLKWLLPFALAVSAFAQYKTEPAGSPPPELNPAIAATLQKDGIRVVGPNGAVVELWFRTEIPSGPKTTEGSVSLETVPHGALMGAARFTNAGSDRRGQKIAPGVYTMRFSMFPENGDHQGVEPQRDFLLLVPVAADTDGSATPDFETLTKSSMKASGTPHPAVFSIWKSDAAETAVSQVGEDWVLNTKVGDVPISMIVVGTNMH